MSACTRLVWIGVAGVAVVATATIVTPGARAVPAAVSPPPLCDALGDPAAAFAVAELARSLGDLDELCGAGFTAALQEAASALADETIDALDLVPPGHALPTGPEPEPTTVPGPVIEAVPAVAGSAELVAAGVVTPGAELDVLVGTAADYCANPSNGPADLVAASLTLAGRVEEWPTNRIAVTIVGEMCAPLVGELVDRLDFTPQAS